ASHHSFSSQLLITAISNINLHYKYPLKNVSMGKT
ncbi:MAG: hypothetical protein ACI97K_003292, partial [Glaciecola sp.]